jgi:putative redox protein
VGDIREVTVAQIEDKSFRSWGPNGGEVVMGTVDGEKRGLSPMELVLSALGGCSGIDVVGILRKAQQKVTGYEIRVRGERAEDHPKVYTWIEVEHVITGEDLLESAVERAVRLSADKYCSVSQMLAKGVDVRHTWRIETGQPTEPVGR